MPGSRLKSCFIQLCVRSLTTCPDAVTRKFTPLDGAAPGTAEPSRKDPTPNLPATAASHPVQQRPALSSSMPGSSQTVAAGKGAPASHGLDRQRAQEARSQGEKRVVEEAASCETSKAELEVPTKRSLERTTVRLLATRGQNPKNKP